MEEFLEFLEETVANNLDIHVKNIDLFYNPISGKIEYHLISSNFTEIQNLMLKIDEDNFMVQLNTDISEVYTNVEIENIVNNEQDGIAALLSITIDTTDASENIQKANEEMEIILKERPYIYGSFSGYNVSDLVAYINSNKFPKLGTNNANSNITS